MPSFLELSTIKNWPELSPDYSLLSDSLAETSELTSSSRPSRSYQVLSESEFDSNSHDLNNIAMTTMHDDAIEILSCHVEQEDEDISGRTAVLPVKLAKDEMIDDDPASIHRKRVVRAVGAVTFLLLLFSLILIGISLNMSKEIDEMVRQSTLAMRNQHPNFVIRKDNLTHHEGT